jgi:hypothetical protein
MVQTADGSSLQTRAPFRNFPPRVLITLFSIIYLTSSLEYISFDSLTIFWALTRAATFFFTAVLGNVFFLLRAVRSPVLVNPSRR